MKNILMIGTGGTIASEMTDDGLTPELTPEQLLRYVPAFMLLLQKAGRSLLQPCVILPENFLLYGLICRIFEIH